MCVIFLRLQLLDARVMHEIYVWHRVLRRSIIQQMNK